MTNQNDERLRSRIRQTLDADPRIDAFEVRVDVRDGVVYLTGLVGSYAERLEAVATVLRMADIRGVENDLVVRPYGDDWRLTDAEIADEARRRLGVALVESGEADVTVDHHVATLTGSVPTAKERAEVRHAVEVVPGVDFVENEIRVAR